jgi:hypothetical protein
VAGYPAAYGGDAAESLVVTPRGGFVFGGDVVWVCFEEDAGEDLGLVDA